MPDINDGTRQFNESQDVVNQGLKRVKYEAETLVSCHCVVVGFSPVNFDLNHRVGINNTKNRISVGLMDLL